MILKRILSLTLAALTALSLAGCGPEGEPPSDSSSASGVVDPERPAPIDTPFTLALFPDFSIHPVLGSNRANLTVSPLLYEPLFQVDGQFEAVPVLCKTYAYSPDKLTWTFTLQDNVTFSDGTPLTGQTVADALNLARGEGSRYAQRLRTVTGITGDGQKVTVTLSRPNGRLPLLLDIPIALGGGDRPAGTGPYVLAGQEKELSFTARPGWWQKKPLPQDEIPIRSVSRSDELIFAFDTGDVSLVEVDILGTNSLVYSSSSETWDYVSPDLIYLGFNTTRGLCSSPDFRRALTRAVDRQAMVQTVFANHGAAASLPVHPLSPLHDETAGRALAYDPQLLAEQAEALPAYRRNLTLLVNSENAAKAAAAQQIVYQLGAAGINVDLHKLPFDEYTAALQRGDFDLYLGEVMLTADFDLSALLAPGGSLNFGGWMNPQAPALLTALAAASPDDGPAAARALFDLLIQDPPVAALCFKNGSVLSQWGRLNRIAPVRGNVFYQLENWTIQ